MNQDTQPTTQEYKREGYKNPIPTTDIIIEYVEEENLKEEKESEEKRKRETKIVLIERKNHPRGLALPGGFAEWGITLDENAKKEAREETGLHVEIDNPQVPFCIRSDPKRDPRGHMTSVVFVAKGSGVIKAGDDAKEAKLYSLQEVRKLLDEKKLVFDHGDILEQYLKHKNQE